MKLSPPLRQWAHGVVVSHPLRMRKALGSIPSVSNFCTRHNKKRKNKEGASNDTVSERLRRWTRNPLGSARRGSNPLGVAFAAQGGVHNKRQMRTLDVRWKQSGMVSHPLCVREALCSTPACPFATAVGAKKNEPNQYKTPTVGLEPTTTRLRALRSAD